MKLSSMVAGIPSVVTGGKPLDARKPLSSARIWSTGMAVLWSV